MSLIEVARSRDVVIFSKGDSITVELDPSLRSWSGGLGVAWASGGDKDTFAVQASDGLFGGFFLWGSDESGDQFVSLTRSQPSYGYAVMGTGNWVGYFSNYEIYTYASRIGGGPLVPLVYNPTDLLYFSLRGLWTKEDEWVLSGDPRGTLPWSCGYVVCPPEEVGAPLLLETTI